MSLPSPPSANPDIELMVAVAERDSRAQRRLVERLAARVLRLARLLCGPSVDAEDAAQVALIEILRSAVNFRVAMSLERWADRITVRTTLRLVHRERERRHLLARWLPHDALPWGRSAEARSHEPLGLDGLLVRLSSERREALVLHHALEYSVEEIAELTGAPIGTVKDRLVAGRKQLRALLDRETRRTSSRGAS